MTALPFDGGQGKRETHVDVAPVEPLLAEPTDVSVPIALPSPSADLDGGQRSGEAQWPIPSVEAPPPATLLTPKPISSASPEEDADAFLLIAADVLDDLEDARIANENRVRSLVQVKGMENTRSHAWLQGVVDALRALEHGAELELKRTLRKHPLGPWIKATVGIGEKQGARLLAAIGDPYMRPEVTRADGTVEPSRPRRGPAELWALCGYHVLAVDQRACDANGPLVDGHFPSEDHHRSAVDRGDSSDQDRHETQSRAVAGVAPRPMRGQRANWNATAKMRAFLVAESCIKQRSSPYRAVYDAGREKYADALHAVECRRCGPRGKPAVVGSPLSDGHKHARALRLVAKAVLKDLFLEARRVQTSTTPEPKNLAPALDETETEG